MRTSGNGESKLAGMMAALGRAMRRLGSGARRGCRAGAKEMRLSWEPGERFRKRVRSTLGARLTILILVSPAAAQPSSQPSSGAVVVPKIWDAKALATWATPVAGLGVAPSFYSEKEYYATPVDNVRTYPVYHPKHEPAGARNFCK